MASIEELSDDRNEWEIGSPVNIETEYREATPQTIMVKTGMENLW